MLCCRRPNEERVSATCVLCCVVHAGALLHVCTAALCMQAHGCMHALLRGACRHTVACIHRCVMHAAHCCMYALLCDACRHTAACIHRCVICQMALLQYARQRLLLFSASSFSHAFPLPPPRSRASKSGVHIALYTAVSKLSE